MSLRTLLVHLDGDARCAARVDFAIQLALRHGAHLVGLAAAGEPRVPVVMEADIRGWHVIADRARQQQHQRAQGWVEAFKAQAAVAGLGACEGLVVDGEAEAAVIRQGRLCDLVVLSQHDRQDTGATVQADFPQRVFMGTGRPVLLVPRARSIKTVGTRVVVAWSGTRESARALADAMPLLQGAEAVMVLNIDRPDEAGASRLELNDLEQALQRHGVTAECVQASTHDDFGDTLLLRAVGFGADLIVMGGFGHARWAELVLGGVTRTVLSTAVVPVLVSH
ncbi:MAG: universal stress protein [Rhizobacter sp.]|nr:universal stress protein [Rhizobacter sp.]